MIRRLGLASAIALVIVVGACARPEPASQAPAPQRADASVDRVAAAALGEGDERLVERVVDGDTVVLLGGERVRVLGINAAEMKHPDPGVHEVALAARRELERLVQGRRVRIVVGMPLEPRDKYDRLLAYLELPGEAEPDVGAQLLEAGLARPYPSAHPRAETYRMLARSARGHRRGLWREGVARTLSLEPEADIACSQAGAHEGRLVRVVGVIEPGRRTPDVQLLRLKDAGGELELVVFPSRYDEIPPELVETWRQHAVAVTGTVSLYKGRPQIKLEDPFQVEPRPST